MIASLLSAFHQQERVSYRHYHHHSNLIWHLPHRQSFQPQVPVHSWCPYNLSKYHKLQRGETNYSGTSVHRYKIFYAVVEPFLRAFTGQMPLSMMYQLEYLIRLTKVKTQISARLPLSEIGIAFPIGQFLSVPSFDPRVMNGSFTFSPWRSFLQISLNVWIDSA